MAAFKQFNTNEVVLTPFYANKDFYFRGSDMTASNVGIEIYQSMQGPYVSGSFPTGFTTRLDQVLVFNNIKQLYYSNYLTQSYGDNPSTASLLAGATPEYNSYYGKTTGPRYDNFLQTSEKQNRDFVQFSASGNINGPTVISIPSKLFGEKIPCGQFNLTYTSSLNYTRSFIHDDEEGNLIATQSNVAGDIVFTGSVGQIFYSQGIAILTRDGEGNLKLMANNIGSDVGIGNNNLDSCSISFSSSITIRENQYKCSIKDSEYTYTQNPSALKPSNNLSGVNNLLSSSINVSTYGDDGNAGTYVLNYNTLTGVGSGATATVIVGPAGKVTNITTLYEGKNYLKGDEINLDMEQLKPGGGQVIFNATGDIPIKLQEGDTVNLSFIDNPNQTYYDYATGSYFSPYVTTIGLYNESFQLVAVGKLSQPIPISLYTDTTFVVNFDT